MSQTIAKFIELRRREQGAHGYPVSSPWCVFTSHAIEHLRASLSTSDGYDGFGSAWQAVRQLSLIAQTRGESENHALSEWGKEAATFPEVKRLCDEMPLALLDAIWAKKDVFLWNNEIHKDREARRLVESWRDKKTRDAAYAPDKAVNYALTIGRDLRNAWGHSDFNRSAPAVKKALVEAAKFYRALAEAAIRATLERPQQGTTGKATAYRSFLYPYLKNSESFFSDYYLEHVFDEKERLDLDDKDLKDGLKSLAKIYKTEAAKARSATPADLLAPGGWLAQLGAALGWNWQSGVEFVGDGQIFRPDAVTTFDGNAPAANYSNKEGEKTIAALLYVVPSRQGDGLDSPLPDVADEAHTHLPVGEVAGRALATSGVPYALVTDGLRFRIYGRHASNRSRAFLEFDLDTLLQSAQSSDEKTREGALNAWSYALRLLSGEAFTARDAGDKTRLVRVADGSEQHAKTLGQDLKKNVFDALEELGAGFLRRLRADPSSAELSEWIAKGAPDFAGQPDAYLDSAPLLDTIYEESLALMYRLLFALYAESRDLLPLDVELYRETYSFEALRDEVKATHDDPDKTVYFSQGSFDLWKRLHELFGLIDRGYSNVIPPYNGGLFDPDNHPFLEVFGPDDYHLARAIDLLSRTQPKKGEGRKKVTYRDLDVRHLGSIYEGLLEYAAAIADQELVVTRRGTTKKVDEYVAPADLKAAEQLDLDKWRATREENKGKFTARIGKVSGVKEAGEYYLAYGGRESKRKSSGSYYTPDYIVKYIVENTLGPLVRGEARPADSTVSGPLSPAEILEVKVLDPAMGSGHFLVEAADFLAQSYGEALTREGAQGTSSHGAEARQLESKRLVVEKCIYGVDLNPMAVELAKLSLWLFTMSKSAPLSFLNHHLKPGNALIGAWLSDLKRARGSKANAKDNGQGNLFENQFKAKLPTMVGAVMDIMARETATTDDVKAKKAADAALDALRRPFVNVADGWTSAYFGEEFLNFEAVLTDVELARKQFSPVAKAQKFFHWELMFPEVWFNQFGQKKENGGFDAVVGNPPYQNAWGMTDSAQAGRNALAKLSNFESYLSGHWDLSIPFIIQGVWLIKANHHCSFILPNSVAMEKYGTKLRQFILSKNHLISIMHFGSENVFEDVSRHCFIPLIRSCEIDSSYEVEVSLSTVEKIKVIEKKSISKNEFLGNFNFQIRFDDDEVEETNFDGNNFWKVGEIFYVNVGATMHSKKPGMFTKYDLLSDSEIGNSKRFVDGKELGIFDVQWSGRFLDYRKGEMYGPRYQELFESPKVLLRKRTSDGYRLIAYPDETDLFCDDTVLVLTEFSNIPAYEEHISYAGYQICGDDKPDIFYLAGILGSFEVAEIFKNTLATKTLQGDFSDVYPKQVREIPVPKPNIAPKEAQQLSGIIRSIYQSEKSVTVKQLAEIDELAKRIFWKAQHA